MNESKSERALSVVVIMAIVAVACIPMFAFLHRHRATPPQQTSDLVSPVAGDEYQRRLDDWLSTIKIEPRQGDGSNSWVVFCPSLDLDQSFDQTCATLGEARAYRAKYADSLAQFQCDHRGFGSSNVAAVCIAALPERWLPTHMLILSVSEAQPNHVNTCVRLSDGTDMVWYDLKLGEPGTLVPAWRRGSSISLQNPEAR